MSLFMSIRDPALGQIVRREFDVNAISHKYPYSISTHSARYRGENGVLAVVYLHLKECVWLLVDDGTG